MNTLPKAKQEIRISMSEWTRRNMFDPKTIKVSMTITKLDKFKLLFRRKQHSYDVSKDGTALTTYKRMNGMIYVLDVDYRPKGRSK